MTNRYVPNEATCPVDLKLLGLMLRSPEDRVAELVEQQTPAQRAALAIFCFQRAHMRELGLQIAKRCDLASLRASGGHVAEMLIDMSQAQPSKASNGRRKVTLARVA